MDLEKYNHLWAKDSEWVLRPRGDSYLILCYHEDGQISTMIIEDDELYEALINRMLSEGVKVLTDDEADALFARMQDMHREKSQKSKALIEEAKQALKNTQFIKKALKELLDNLDEVSDNHPEIHDTMVREILNSTILQFFVFNSDFNDLSLDNYYGLFSDEGNEAVHQVLIQFLIHPEVNTARQRLTIPEERLVVFQDSEVVSSKGNHYDWYFGWVSSL